jgi:CheY-like chemotaxis protein
MNLTINARDAMPAGGSVTIATSNAELGDHHGHDPDVPGGSYAMLVVRDTGCGMDAETLSHIFEPFFTTKEPGEGTGLGLSTVYGTVEQSGGALRVLSAPDEGTTFTLYFPRAAGSPAAASPSGIREKLPGGTATILVVEDEDSVRHLTALELEEIGYDVLQAKDLDEALSVSRGHDGRIHLMLTDVVLPKTSGPDVYDQVSVDRPELRVLYMSGHAERRIVSHGVLEAGIAFIGKPFTSEQLAARVREALDREGAR